MAQEGYITKEQAQTAKEEELQFAQVSRTIKAPHFVLYVQQYLLEKYGETFLKVSVLRRFHSQTPSTYLALSLK